MKKIAVLNPFDVDGLGSKREREKKESTPFHKNIIVDHFSVQRKTVFIRVGCIVPTTCTSEIKNLPKKRKTRLSLYGNREPSFRRSRKRISILIASTTRH